MLVPILTIDGPSGSGKGTVAARIAEQLGWHCLDSGALYRLVGLGAAREGMELDDASALAGLAARLPVEFAADGVRYAGEDVSREIRSEQAGDRASRVAALQPVRDALLGWQRGYAREPGLVADGRDMGTVVFPAAGLKIFLDASAEERANRRHKQLMEKGMNVTLTGLVEEIRERDQRDRARQVSPLRPADDAVEIDSTLLSVEQVVERILQLAVERFPDAASRLAG